MVFMKGIVLEMHLIYVLNNPKLILKFSNKNFRSKNILKLIRFSRTIFMHNFIFISVYIFSK